ncbi:MAG: hypothetical protein V4682_03835 [Patescibacteria group bacterium]
MSKPQKDNGFRTFVNTVSVLAFLVLAACIIFGRNNSNDPAPVDAVIVPPATQDAAYKAADRFG